MASKQVVRRERSTLAVAKAVEQFIPSISDSLITAVRPQLAAGETMPDVALLGILIQRTLEVRLADFVKANAASEAEASDDVEPRERRDRLEVELPAGTSLAETAECEAEAHAKAEVQVEAANRCQEVNLPAADGLLLQEAKRAQPLLCQLNGLLR